MNVLFISQCSKRALSESRRILDQFAERRGDRTWQTPITQAGLETLRKLLRKTARKNSAVACHWIRGLDHTELLWIVGDASQFNAIGAVPTNTTQRNVLRSEDEHHWRNGEIMLLLTELAGLLHDIGKACDAFQDKLNNKNDEPNQYRHEWISLRLFQAFVSYGATTAPNDTQWLTRLAAAAETTDKVWEAQWLKNLLKDGVDESAKANKPLEQLSSAPLAQALGWLVVSHHRLPQKREEELTQGLLRAWTKSFDSNWNGAAPQGNDASRKKYWKFTQGVPVSHPDWRARAAAIAKRLLELSNQVITQRWLDDPFVMHVSRMSLMLADHHYSSLHDTQPNERNPERVTIKNSMPLHANTHDGALNQHLDEHLIGVAKHGKAVIRALRRFERDLPRLGRHTLLRKRASDAQFQWQNKAFEMAQGMRDRSAEQGGFIVNLASTGCGKTLANARVMYALAHPQLGMRCAFAMGLRTLTLQTGSAFKKLLNLDDESLAVRVGDSASRELFKQHEAQAEKTGSASSLELLDDASHVLFEGNTKDNPLLSKILKNPQLSALLLAPILVCTIDHLTPATEADRGGRQIAPMLRLLSGDLVLDEPDDFDLNDLPALARLVNWAGLLGARVLLSSATLPPALVSGLFDAYREGRKHFMRNRASTPLQADAEPQICCMWIDEYASRQADCAALEVFCKQHAEFIHQRVSALAVEKPRRQYELLALRVASADHAESEFARLASGAAWRLHQNHHSVDAASGKRVSFGLIRVANISALFEVALALYQQTPPPGVHVHLCVYHSRFPMIMRSEIERLLDLTLNRRHPDAVFNIPEIRQGIDGYADQDHLFVVLGSPVTEVGRDHDYDWAVLEPSSVRSLVQLAGRVRRHRRGECSGTNMLVFDHNLRHFRSPNQPAFCMPGFEDSNNGLATHDLAELLKDQPVGIVDARPRIQVQAAELQPTKRLIDLEHKRLQDLMQRREDKQVNATNWWLPGGTAHLTALLQHKQEFRKTTERQVDLYFLPDDEEPDADCTSYSLRQIMQTRSGGKPQFVEVAENSKLKLVEDTALENGAVTPWRTASYLELLAKQAEVSGTNLGQTARRFGRFTAPTSEQGWRFHELLGLTPLKN